MKHHHLIGIAGGIGSGKSIISRILRLKGFTVYDCDTEAKHIMQRPEIADRICTMLGCDIRDTDGQLDRHRLSQYIFSDAKIRKDVESIVHPAVLADIIDLLKTPSSDNTPIFVESAIIASSGIADVCSSIWLVTAPEKIRISRVMQRNGISEAEIRSRIEAQEEESNRLRHALKHKIHIIENSGNTPLVHCIEELLNKEVND